jgi:hypothetical protein
MSNSVVRLGGVVCKDTIDGPWLMKISSCMFNLASNSSTLINAPRKEKILRPFLIMNILGRRALAYVVGLSGDLLKLRED